MKTRLKWTAAAFVLAITAAAFIPFGFLATPLRQELTEHARRTMGLPVVADGPVRFALLPWPRVTYRNVVIGGEADGVQVRAERMRADLSASRLLAGRVEFSTVVLTRPAVDIDLGLASAGSAPAIKRASEAPSASNEARRADRLRLGALRVSRGEVRLRTPDQHDLLLRDVDASLDWGSLGSAAALSGSATWRGERFSVEALLSKPAEVMRGEKSPFALKLTSRVAELTLNGSVTGGARWLLDARLASTSERFGQLIELLEIQSSVPVRPARVALTGQIRALPQSATLSDLRLTLDGSAFDGALAIRAGVTRPLISGTLATRAYEVRVGRGGLPVLRGRDRHWNRDGLPLGTLDMFDADLRLSAGRISFGRATLTDAGFLVAINDGRLDVTAAGAEFYGGSLRGRLVVDTRPALPEVRLTGALRDINLGSLSRSIADSNRLAGTVDLETSVETLGISMQAMMQQLAGSLRVNARNLEVVGVDLERAVRRTEKRPLSIPVELRTGQTAFTSASLSGQVAGGVLKIENAGAHGPGLDVRLGGVVGVADRTLRLDIVATQPRSASAAAAAGKEPASLILDLAGSWDDPQLSIDPETLINRSEAAAPLARRQQPQPSPAAAPVAAPAALDK